MDRLVDIEGAKSFEHLTRIVRGQLNCVGVLVTKITNDKQIVLANTGMILPAKFQEKLPLEYSICQHSVAMNFPLVIDDTITHPLMKGNLAFSELGIFAYLGAPVYAIKNSPIRAICGVVGTRFQKETPIQCRQFILGYLVS